MQNESMIFFDEKAGELNLQPVPEAVFASQASSGFWRF